MKAGWHEAALHEVAELRPPKKRAREAVDDTALVSFVPMEHLQSGDRDLAPHGSRPLKDVYSAYTYFADGDVLLAKITPCFENGKQGVARGLKNGIGFGSSEFFVIRPSDQLDADFLNYFLDQQSVRDAGARVMSGAVGHKRVPKEHLEQLPIPLPPLEEQQRIVAILDEAFEGLARAKANAEANLASAKELFASVIEAALRDAGGDRRTLQQLIDDGSITSHLDGNHGSNYPRKDEFVSRGVPYISANCITGTQVDLGRAKYLSAERAGALTKGIARNRDVLFAHNATVGPVALLETDEERVVLSTSLTYYRCDERMIIPEYLVCEMRSAGFTRQYREVMGQATRNQVPITAQRKLYHTIPSLQAQREVAELGVALDQSTMALLASYRRSVANLDQLRQCLLQKAFAGELT